MTLIEVLAFYRDLVKHSTRELADRWLHESTDIFIWEHVESSVDNEGNFIDAEGYRFNP